MSLTRRFKRVSTPWRALFALVALSLPLGASAQEDFLGEGASAFLNTVARLPLSLEFGGENLFARRVGFRVGGSLYPVPLILDRELNVDAFADLTYTLRGGVGGSLAGASASLYVGAGPRYRIINSELFLEGEPPGSFVGAGAVAGADFSLRALGFALVSAFAEGGGDYIWELGEEVGTGRLTPKVRVGLSIPFVGTY